MTLLMGFGRTSLSSLAPVAAAVGLLALTSLPLARALDTTRPAATGAAARAVAAPAAAGKAASRRTPNPHFQPTGCVSCHAVDGGKPKPIAPATVDTLCLACHDGVRAKEEAHPIGVPAGAEQSHLQWPLLDGRLGCLTCHDMKQACDQRARRPSARSQVMLLRVAPAPAAPAVPAAPAAAAAPPPSTQPVRAAAASGRPQYLNNSASPAGSPSGKIGQTVKAKKPAPSSQTFCANCHTPSDYQRHNPHLMLDASRKAVQDSCLFCHEKAPDAAAVRRTGQASLRRPQLELCGSCHARHMDPAPNGHIGAVPTAEMKAYIRAREITGLLATPTKPMLEQLRAQNAAPTLMPFDRGGAVQCTTCHNPHQFGTFSPESPLGYREMRVIRNEADHTVKTVSPVRGENWCRHCHDS